MPEKTQVIVTDEYVAFLHMTWSMGVPTILFVLHVSIELEAQASVHGKTIVKEIGHLFSNDKNGIDSFSGLSNILAHLRALENDNDGVMRATLQNCTNLMDKLCCGTEEHCKVLFLREQLLLAFTPKNSRRYSSDLLATAVLWKTSSPSLYKQMRSEGYLTLPGFGYLQRLTTSLNVETGLSQSTFTYLQARAERLDMS